MDSMFKGTQNPSLLDQNKLVMMIMVEHCRAQDLLFEQTGFEEEHLLYSIQYFNMEHDPKFI